jgi:hypothetical protein
MKKITMTLLAPVLLWLAAGCDDNGGNGNDADAVDIPVEPDGADADGTDDVPAEPDVPSDGLEDPVPDAPVDPLPDGEDAADTAEEPLPGIWRPSPGTSWQWQLTGTIDTSLDVDMYDIDLFEAPQAVIDGLRGRGIVVICYFSAGSHENWRPDADDFPSSVIGNALEGWPGERWLDIRSSEVRNIMEQRLDLAASKHCDGVEPDNVDAYDGNNPGFPLTYEDQIDYNTFLAAEAHERGLSVGLKNDLAQVDDLLDLFDWALNEECFDWDECGDLQPFIDAGKAVFHVEYGDEGTAADICPQANALNFDSIIKNYDLDEWRIPCR